MLVPRATIEMLEGRKLDQKRALAREICAAISECYELSREAGLLRFVEVKLEDFASNGELRWDTSLREGRVFYGRILEPRITIQFLELYTQEMKRNLVKRISEKVSEILGAEPSDVKIYIQEMKLSQYASAGVIASDSMPSEWQSGAVRQRHDK